MMRTERGEPLAFTQHRRNATGEIERHPENSSMMMCRTDASKKLLSSLLRMGRLTFAAWLGQDGDKLLCFFCYYSFVRDSLFFIKKSALGDFAVIDYFIIQIGAWRRHN
jgi:hypothetical protein